MKLTTSLVLLAVAVFAAAPWIGLTASATIASTLGVLGIMAADYGRAYRMLARTSRKSSLRLAA